MSCEARVLGDESGLKGFYYTKSCNNSAKKKIIIADDYQACCDECFRRYNTGKEWYGWMDGLYPPEAPVVGSRAFYLSSTTEVKVVVPTQKTQGGCATCWRTTFDKTQCKVCEVQLCRACASVPPPGQCGDFCKVCVPKWRALPVVAAPAAAPAPEPEIESLTAQMAAVAVAAPAAEPKAKPKPKASLDYPIREDIATLPLNELKALHAALVAWMKKFETKLPRLLVPYYSYRMRLEALMIQKK
jgi:hypothetical protein